MSFPSAVRNLEEMGVTIETATPEQCDQALTLAFEHDTVLGFTALGAMVDAVRERVADPLSFVRKHLEPLGVADDVLRSEARGQGVKIDFNPLSKVGLEISRLLGTDGARRLIENRLGMPFGFANCCGPSTSPRPRDVQFDSRDQIRWQLSIDC